MKIGTKACPRCAETIKIEAKVCRHCQHEFTPAENAEAEVKDRGARFGKNILIVVGGIAVVWFIGSSISGNSYRSVDRAALVSAASAPTKVNTIRIDRFSWQNRGDRYCDASAKITNTSDRDLSYVRITTQFLKGGQLVGSDYAFADANPLPAGGSTTWDNMYECPGSGTTIDVSATSSEGLLQVDAAAEK